MANQHPKLVNKQFNSPINLYSANNIREVLDRETRMLSNGAVGINFHNPNIDKPTNLQNSAVLRLLEEEEQRQRSGQSPSIKRVAWPPPPEAEGHLSPVNVQDLLTQPQQQQRPYQPQQTQAFKQPYTAGPPPSVITLRPEAPINQIPAPVYSSQPATATLMGGKNMRGDLKWPPPDTKAQMDAENQARMELAKGPLFRPRKVRKDYSKFFAQNALNSTYPGYKAPPGTQYYAEGISNF